MIDPYNLSDALGPEKVLFINNKSVGLRAIVVIDNTACGTAIGGCRMATDVSLEECARLARAMTLKNASAGLPHGGGKSVIYADPSMDLAKKQSLMRAFACAIGQTTDYIVGPDMGTNEHLMACVYDEIHRAVGLPREIGGIPLDDIGATGWGLVAAAKAAEPFSGVTVAGATFAVQGFGAVGYHAARYLENEGAKMVGVCDSSSSLYCADGINVQALKAYKTEHGKLNNFTGGGENASADAIIELPCDIWIPAARPDIITMKNVNKLRTRLIVQGANIPITLEAEEHLHNKGVVSIPDFIANAGGVICAAVEYRKGAETEAMQLISDKVTFNTINILRQSAEQGITPRAAATRQALENIQIAESYRRFKS